MNLDIVHFVHIMQMSCFYGYTQPCVALCLLYFNKQRDVQNNFTQLTFCKQHCVIFTQPFFKQQNFTQHFNSVEWHLPCLKHQEFCYKQDLCLQTI